MERIFFFIKLVLFVFRKPHIFIVFFFFIKLNLFYIIRFLLNEGRFYLYRGLIKNTDTWLTLLTLSTIYRR